MHIVDFTWADLVRYYTKYLIEDSQDLCDSTPSSYQTLNLFYMTERQSLS